jgi:transcriptional regulator with XRE-family HTH domain
MKLNFFSEPFARTLREFHISGAALATKAGVSQNHVSKIKNGENVTVETLSAIMSAMEELKPGSIEYFLNQVQKSAAIPQKPETSQVSFRYSLSSLVEAATDEEIEGVLLAVSKRWRTRLTTSDKNSDLVA